MEYVDPIANYQLYVTAGYAVGGLMLLAAVIVLMIEKRRLNDIYRTLKNSPE
jgi:hypothetical protein